MQDLTSTNNLGPPYPAVQSAGHSRPDWVPKDETPRAQALQGSREAACAPSGSRCAHSPVPPFLNKMTQQHAAPWPWSSSCTPQSSETPQWGSSRVPTQLC